MQFQAVTDDFVPAWYMLLGFSTDGRTTMNDLQKHTAADIADKDILRGPPGLLLGLTLFVFVAARLCFGWESSSTPQDEVAAEQAVPQQADELPALLTRADFVHR
jgi:hypothetical protein